MKTTVQHIREATLVLTKIINEQRPLPLKGKFLVARLHSKLLPEFTVADAKRDELINAYGHHEMIPPPRTKDDPLSQGPLVEAEAFSVPLDKMSEFTAHWKQIADEEIEVDVQPIPLSALTLGDDIDGSIHAYELITLGDFITE